MRLETKRPVVLEHCVMFTAVRGLGTRSALVLAQQVIHGALLSRPRYGPNGAARKFSLRNAS